MESAGSAVVDFGRFCTGFLVVMGVGMYFRGTNAADAWLLHCRLRYCLRNALTCVCKQLCQPY